MATERPNGQNPPRKKSWLGRLGEVNLTSLLTLSHRHQLEVKKGVTSPRSAPLLRSFPPFSFFFSHFFSAL